MLAYSSRNIIGDSDVESTFAILENVNAIGSGHSANKLVAGAGFEPAIPQPRDYEPGRDRPVIL
jgi:hypothetical protein